MCMASATSAIYVVLPVRHRPTAATANSNIYRRTNLPPGPGAQVIAYSGPACPFGQVLEFNVA